MKKIIITLCLAGATAGMAAVRQSVKIGNVEINFGKRDTITPADEHQLRLPEGNGSAAGKRARYKRRGDETFIGVGFALPNDGSRYYSLLGVNSYNIDFGYREYQHLNRWLAAGYTLQYSFYSYRLKDAIDDPAFLKATTGTDARPSYEIDKQAYRSHNVAVGIFTRCYLAPHTAYLDLGVQGDLSFSKHYRLYYSRDGRQEFRNNHAFNPFIASAVAQVGLKSFAIFARYSLTNVFNHSEIPRDLPPLSIGIRIGG
jgi:hypothetical protein